jgi:hypothetical protein
VVLEQMFETGGGGGSWDNADDVHEHHVHQYSRRGEKENPMILEFNSINEAMAVAKEEARMRAAEIVRQWRES